MEFGFSQKEIEFQEEVEEFLKKELPPDWPEKSRHWPGGYGTIEMQSQEMADTAQEFRRKLAQKGWFTIAWPEEHGGKAHSYIEQAIFDERISYFRAPSVGIATGIAGPTILRFGTEENKQDWIPRIANAEIEMWLAYSQPDAGSDLAGLQTPRNKKY
jgi:alkylation response protein AidB-like acyl-CoA dehydrogenase